MTKKGGFWRFYFLVLPVFPTRCPSKFVLLSDSSIATSLEIQQQAHKPEGESLRAFWIVCFGNKFRLLLEKKSKTKAKPRTSVGFLPSPQAALFLLAEYKFLPLKQEHQPNMWTSPFPFIRRMLYFKLSGVFKCKFRQESYLGW